MNMAKSLFKSVWYVVTYILKKINLTHTFFISVNVTIIW